MINVPWTLTSFTKALGQSNRVLHRINDIQIYEKQGIILFQKPGQDQVVDFNIYYSKYPEEIYNWLPKGNFSGKLKVEVVSFSRKMTISELIKILTEYDFKISYTWAWRGEYNRVYTCVSMSMGKKFIGYQLI